MSPAPSWREAPADFLLHLFDVAVRSALPTAERISSFLPAPGRGRMIVVGAGKAAGSMAAALDAAWPRGSRLEGLVVTRYDSVPPAYRALAASGQARIEVVEAAHPVPDQAGARAAARILDRVRGLREEDLVVCLMSGGASALLAMPAPGLSLDAKQGINRQLLASGAAIDEMNCVRKHLSAIKGGRLAATAAPARVVTLVVSDVPGDSPATVGSGPTVPDPTTCADALAIVDRHRIRLPDDLRGRLRDASLETPKPGDAVFAGHAVHLIATPQQSLDAAAAAARAAGLDAHVLSDRIEGEARDVARVHAAIALQVAERRQPFAPPCVLISGGETTVTVRRREGASGRGGRGSEFALGLAIALQGAPAIHAIAADTDGIDGSEDNAGARVSPSTIARASALGVPARALLDGHDAHSFFAALGDLVVTGPTYTNVNDFRAILIDR